MPSTRDLPGTILERLPLPSLRMYAAGSVTLLSASLYYAMNVTSDANWRKNSTAETPEAPMVAAGPQNVEGPGDFLHRAAEVSAFMIQEPLCIWTVINMAYCLLALMGTQIQRAVFGPLRVSETQHVKDKFWNFVFYKFIFVFGVINVQYMDEVLLWCSWFTVLGFLHLLSQLCKDRFEYVSNCPPTPRRTHARLLTLLVCILTVSIGMLAVCITTGLRAGLDTFALMSAECILLMSNTLHVLVRYALHLYEASLGSTRDSRVTLSYYIQLSFDMWALVLELAHHLHMLLWSNIFLSMASLVILMQLRYLFHEIQARLRKHRMYLWVLKHMDTNYPMATAEEVTENSDNCAICWEKMDSARKLPCSHLFHNYCLSSWLQQDTSCPTCRRSLPSWGAPPQMPREPPPAPPETRASPPRRTPNHFFHFDGSRYVSWLPSFSVEVTSVRVPEPQDATSRMDAMARRVQRMFPHYPLSTIMRDLEETHQAEYTVENILEGRLPTPPAFMLEPEEPLTLESLEGPGEGAESTIAVVAGGREAVDAWAEQNDAWEEASAVSTRFSKNSYEREKILRRRKEQLLGNARRKYIEKMSQTQTEEETASTSSERSQDT